MTKFSFLRLAIIFLTFILIGSNFFVFSTKSVKVDAIIESSSSSNNSVPISSSVPNSSLKSSIASSSSRSQSSSNSVSRISSSSSIIPSSSSKTATSVSSAISRSSSSNSVTSTVPKLSSSIRPTNSSSSKSNSSNNSSVSLVISSSKTLSSATISVLPIKITEVGFTRPELFNSKICINNCGQFKWVEIFNPNDIEINLKDYRIIFENFRDQKNKLTEDEADFFVKRNSFALIKSFSIDQTTSIIDIYPNVIPNGFVKNVDSKPDKDRLSVKIQNSVGLNVDSFVIDNLSLVAGTNAGKIKTSFFRCSNPDQNQNYSLTEKKSINQIPYNNSLGYEFYGTPNRDDDSCIAQSSSSIQPIVSGTGININNTPPAKVVDLATNPHKAIAPATEPVKNVGVATDPISEAVKPIEVVKEVIKLVAEVKIPEIIPSPNLVTQRIFSYELPKNVNIQTVNIETKKEQAEVEQKIDTKEIVQESKPIINKLLEYHKQAIIAEKIEDIESNNALTIQYQNKSLIEDSKTINNLVPTKIFISFVKPVIKPVTKKVILRAVSQNIEEKEVLEIDYQPSQLQWNFLSLIAIAFVFSKIYSEFKDKIGLEVFGISKV